MPARNPARLAELGDEFRQGHLQPGLGGEVAVQQVEHRMVPLESDHVIDLIVRSPPQTATNPNGAQ